ncbi:MAG: PaaI family thioesterase [Pseudomonadota bacterium]
MSDAAAAPPEGFERHARRSPVTDPWEPLWSRLDEAGALQLGLRLAEPHCNSRGFAHGGVIAALADNAMGLTYVGALRARGRDGVSAVTVSLSLDYVAAGRLGQWLQVSPVLIRAGGVLGFVEARIEADGETAARASATFRSVEPARPS